MNNTDNLTHVRKNTKVSELFQLNRFIKFQNKFNAHIAKRVDGHDAEIAHITKRVDGHDKEIDALRLLVIKSSKDGIAIIKKYLRK